jgi:hypothetical protein
MADSAVGQKAGLVVGEHCGSLNEFGLGTYRVVIPLWSDSRDRGKLRISETSEADK